MMIEDSVKSINIGNAQISPEDKARRFASAAEVERRLGRHLFSTKIEEISILHKITNLLPINNMERRGSLS